MFIVRYGRFCRASIAWRHAANGWPNSARFAGNGNWGQPRTGFPTFPPDVTADDFVLSSVVIPDDGELYMDLKLTPHRMSFWLGPYPHIREFSKMIAHLAPGRYWHGRYFKAGEAEDERISGETSFRFNGVRVSLTPKEQAAVREPVEAGDAVAAIADHSCKTRAEVW